MKRGIFILVPLLLLAQNYVLKKDVLSSGGRKMTSTNYILQGTISQTAIGSVTDTDYQGVIGFWHPPEAFPPIAPYINPAQKSGSDVELTWNMITTDTLGNPETVHYYVVYRSTSPSFIPGPSDSVGATIQPDTVFTDAGALSSGNSYYYLVKAVDITRNRSLKSNMGYKLNKFVNENAGATGDRNWISLPWHSEYDSVLHLTADLSPSGTPLSKITNLTETQIFKNWIHHPVLSWYGDTFDIISGSAYEMIAVTDDTVILVGSNNPSGFVVLYENSGAMGDRNWISTPYNAAYTRVIDITDEYSSGGEAVAKITNLRNDQVFENWIHHPVLSWYGDTFDIIPGRGYEFIAIVDTTWNPTEYDNKSFIGLASRTARITGIETHLGRSIIPERSPNWTTDDIAYNDIARQSNKKVNYHNPSFYKAVKTSNTKKVYFREAGISHVVRASFTLKECEKLAFTSYRLGKPYDVLTENTVGCGYARKNDFHLVWFDVGNFMQPWDNGEEVILVVEVVKQGRGYYAVINFELDKCVDIQELGEIALIPLPEPAETITLSSLSWTGVDNDNIVGYSLYQNKGRVNDEVIESTEYALNGKADLRLIIRGGYETVFCSSEGIQSFNSEKTPIAYAFNIAPNPFNVKTGINYALPHKTEISIRVYDVTGRKVKTIVSGKLDPGFYDAAWDGKDDIGRRTAAGVYFIKMDTDVFTSQQKIVYVR